MELVASATMLTNDSYFIGNLYHLIIYSSKCAYSYEKGIYYTKYSILMNNGGRT